MRICQTLASPSTTRLMPRVMISGWTRKTPTPTPVTRPATAAAMSAMSRAIGSPCEPTRVATRNPDIEATAPTDRSMPPVRKVSVWQAARMASGMPARRMTPNQPGVTIVGWTRAMIRTSRPSSRTSGMIGRSRNRRRQPARLSNSLRVSGVAVALVTSAISATG
jgi:hypothetical protein